MKILKDGKQVDNARVIYNLNGSPKNVFVDGVRLPVSDFELVEEKTDKKAKNDGAMSTSDLKPNEQNSSSEDNKIEDPANVEPKEVVADQDNVTETPKVVPAPPKDTPNPKPNKPVVNPKDSDKAKK